MLLNEDSAAQSQGEPNVIVCGARGGALGMSVGCDKLPLEVVAQLPLPGIVIFVHGVNSDGEWYQAAEKGLCNGLNTRLKRVEGKIDHPNVAGGQMAPVTYVKDLTPDGYLNPEKTSKSFIAGDEHYSPVIHFRWGYKGSAADMKLYGDALYLNENNYWGGGPFANGCSSIPDLWEGGLNDQLFLWLHAQHLNPTNDRMVYACPHRGYYVAAALRLAMLIGEIRKKQADVPVTIVCHSQGNMVSIAAAFLGDKLGKVTDSTGKPGNCVANNYVLCNPPYSLLKSNFIEGWTQLGTGRQTYEARIGTLKHFFEIMKQQAAGDAKAQSAADIDAFNANDKHAFSTEKDRKKYGFGADPEKSNYGRVTLYFNPHDQVISASPVQGIGWRGMSQSEINDAGGQEVFCQRVFAQDFPVGFSLEKCKQYDFWKDHHVKNTDGSNLKAGSNQFWYPESLRAQYSIEKGTDANENPLPKVMTVLTAPIFQLVFKVVDVRINGIPDKGWVTPLQAPELDPWFKPQSMRFGKASPHFDEGFDAPGSSRNMHRVRDASDPYASVTKLQSDPRDPEGSPDTDEPLGNEDTEASLLYEHHALLRMRAKREHLSKNSDATAGKYAMGDKVEEEDNLAGASDGYKAWRAQKIKKILADTVGTPATDHSTILTNPDHSEKALAYDIPVGLCHIAKEDLAELRMMADWRFLDGLDENHPVAQFVKYFDTGMMDSKPIAKWVEDNNHATIPPKVVNKRWLY
jgi:hypothetical protein